MIDILINTNTYNTSVFLYIIYILKNIIYKYESYNGIPGNGIRIIYIIFQKKKKKKKITRVKQLTLILLLYIIYYH